MQLVSGFTGQSTSGQTGEFAARPVEELLIRSIVGVNDWQKHKLDLPLTRQTASAAVRRASLVNTKIRSGGLLYVALSIVELNLPSDR